MIKDLLKDSLVKVCVICGAHPCLCPTLRKTQKLIPSIKQKNVKNNKWVTYIYGNFTKDLFINLKTNLGTGGTYEVDCMGLRGRVKNRVKKILLSMGYSLSDNS